MFNVIVAGTVIATVSTKAEAENLIAQAKTSPLGWVHPKDAFRIANVEA